MYVKIINSKSEIRNSKQIINYNVLMFKTKKMKKANIYPIKILFMIFVF